MRPYVLAFDYILRTKEPILLWLGLVFLQQCEAFVVYVGH